MELIDKICARHILAIELFLNAASHSPTSNDTQTNEEQSWNDF
jgi:hypothetical protein